MTDARVEAVAEALWANHRAPVDGSSSWTDWHDSVRDEFRRDARTALAAADAVDPLRLPVAFHNGHEHVFEDRCYCGETR